MSLTEILVQKVNNQLCACILKDGTAIDIYSDNRPEFARWASIYIGKVDKIDKNLNGAFINLGGNRTGFLPVKHVVKNGVIKRNGRIEKLLTPGQMIFVQVKSEAKQKTRFETAKMPRLSMKIYLPGRMMYFNPYGASNIHIPKSMDHGELNAFTKTLQKFGSWHFKETTAPIDIDDIKREAKSLILKWDAIKEAKQKSLENARMIFEGPNAAQRLFMDYGYHQFERIEIAEDAYTPRIEKWLNNHAFYITNNIVKTPTHKIDLFEMRDVYGELDKAISPLVPLPSSGSLIVDHTHAMTIVDVNSGGEPDLLKVNTEAARHLVRHIRLRNLSGIILVDFINLATKSDRYALLKAIETFIGRDAGNTKVHGFTRLGLVEITRTRRTATLFEKMPQQA